MRTKYSCLYLLLSITLLSGVVLLSTNVSANDSATTVTTITVPVACTLRGIGTDSHTATLAPNTYSGASGSEYENGIGKTTLTAICNDDNGFSIYAIGYTGNSYDSADHTKLIGQNTNGTISTKAYASGDTTSNWSMKLTKVDNPVSGDPVTYNPQNLAISTGYDSWHAIPDTYTKVAQYKANTGSSTTDTTLGVKLETTYAAYIATNQPADTYIGQVKYTMVHPYDEQPLQPVVCQSGRICYSANGSNVEGTMSVITAYDGNTRTLLASNYSREGYGFAGWSDAFDYATNPNAHFYGPNEEIVVPTGTTKKGLSLYAVWVKSAGTMQSDTASVCSNLTAATYNDENDSDESTWSITANLNSISALTDTRDGDTYAIAKLTDGRCWMIENLRLADTHQDGANTVPTTLTTSNTNNPLNDGTTVTLKHNYSDTITYTNLSATSSAVYDASTAPDGWCNAESAECYDQSRIVTDNTTNRATSPTNASSSIYSYGNYYNWYSATAGRGTYNKNSGNTEGDLCPFGWHLPTGTGSGEFGLLSNSLGGYKNSSDVAQQMDNTTTPSADIMKKRLKQFPNNIVLSGTFTVNSNNAIFNNRGGYGNYWTSSSRSNNAAYSMSLATIVNPGIGTIFKWSGMPVRCIANPSS